MVMKKLLTALIIIITWSVMASGQDLTSGMFTETVSKYGFQETVDKLNDAVTSAGWKVSVVHNLQEALKKANYNVLPVSVFEVCNPKYSGKLLDRDELRIYSPLMPCRFSVYEKSDGKTYVSRMNSFAIASQIGGEVEEVMTMAANDVEEFIKQATEL